MVFASSIRKKNRRNTAERPKTSLRVTTRVNLRLVIVFARLLFQYGAGNCKKGYSGGSQWGGGGGGSPLDG